MASSERNLELARRSIGAWIAGDRDDTLVSLADDIEVFVAPELANTGSFRGKQEFLRWIAQWEDAWDDLEFEVRELRPVGERHVIATMHQRATGRGSGIPVEMDVAFLTDVREDKIAALHLYATADDARRVAEQREST